MSVQTGSYQDNITLPATMPQINHTLSHTKRNMSAKLPQATTPRIKAFPYYTFVVYVPPSQFRYDPVPFLLTQVPARSLQFHHHHSHSWYFPFHFRSSSSLSNSRTHPPHRFEWRATSSAPVPSETPSGWPQAMLPSLRAVVRC